MNKIQEHQLALDLKGSTPLVHGTSAVCEHPECVALRPCPVHNVVNEPKIVNPCYCDPSNRHHLCDYCRGDK